MEDGRASHTARRVAARRLGFPRIETPYGDPAADLALARDVADDLTPPSGGRMHDYLRARTTFFDRIVVTSIDDGTSQIVVGAAGYDGRAFRYAKHGVRWFEVDHPATQADKLDRIGRLGIDARHVRFVAADFNTDPIAGPLTAAGLDPARPALFLLEGIAVYLDREVIERVLRQFREVTVDGGLLAISVSLATGGSPARERFRASVAAHGEPVRSALTPREAGLLLAGQGWQVTQGRDRLRAAGLLLARATEPSSSYPERTGPAPRPASAPRAAPARSGPAVPPPPGSLPPSALLSQTLVAFTVECDNEAEHLLPHRTATHGLQPDAPADARDLGKRPSRDALIRPTAHGSQARDVWHEVPGTVEARWRTRFGPARVAALRASLEPLVHGDPPPLFAGLEPYPDNWRARVRPQSLLPHYPMVLHRGGFPDGS
jgi:methyltransferase (TIGR00027 family)